MRFFYFYLPAFVQSISRVEHVESEDINVNCCDASLALSKPGVVIDMSDIQNGMYGSLY